MSKISESLLICLISRGVVQSQCHINGLLESDWPECSYQPLKPFLQSLYKKHHTTPLWYITYHDCNTLELISLHMSHLSNMLELPIVEFCVLMVKAGNETLSELCIGVNHGVILGNQSMVPPVIGNPV